MREGGDSRNQTHVDSFKCMRSSGSKTVKHKRNATLTLFLHKQCFTRGNITVAKVLF